MQFVSVETVRITPTAYHSIITINIVLALRL